MRSFVRGWAVVAIVGLALALPAATRAQTVDADADQEARIHFQLGKTYHSDGRFAEAAAEFQKAYDLSQRPQLLYNVFVAHRDAGNNEQAAIALRKFLEEENEEDIPDRPKLEARLAALDKLVAQEKEQEAQRAEAERQAEEARRAAEEARAKDVPMEPNPVHKYTPWALVGTGGAMVVVGAVMGGLAAKDEKALEKDCPDNVCTSQSDLDTASSGKTKALVSDIMIIGGAVTAGAGVALWFLLPRERPAKPTTADVFCGPGACGASVTHRF